MLYAADNIEDDAVFVPAQGPLVRANVQYLVREMKRFSGVFFRRIFMKNRLNSTNGGIFFRAILLLFVPRSHLFTVKNVPPFTTFLSLPINTVKHNLSSDLQYWDKEKLFRISEGDEKAFYELYDTYTSLLLPFLRSYTRSESDIEEIIQETFIRVWINRDKLPEVKHVKNWIYTIAARLYLNRSQSATARNIVLQHDVPQLADMETPYRSMRVKELREAIRTAVANLSPQRALIFRMNREMGLKPSLIAEELNLSVSSVKNQLSLGLKQIREELTAAGFGPVAVLWALVTII